MRKVITLTQPVAMAVRAGEAKAVYVAQKTGVIRRLTILSGGGVSLSPTVVLDISEQVLNEGEQGLLGIAFSPDGTKLYVFFTDKSSNNGVYEYPFAAGVADESQQRTVLAIPHPTYSNHNGGNIAFGPDGFLYAATGDGGGGGDPDNNGQDPTSLLGKFLRINPVTGATEVRHIGLRNPWRWSFDRSNGDLWIGDVGQRMYEEIDRVPFSKTGANFGWNLREGRHPYDGGARPPGNVDPVYEYTHANGNCSVTGGYVYRGSRIGGLQGAYLFADFCVGQLKKRVGSTVSNLGPKVAHPSSFGQDASGELWVLSLDGPVYRLIRR